MVKRALPPLETIKLSGLVTGAGARPVEGNPPRVGGHLMTRTQLVEFEMPAELAALFVAALQRQLDEVAAKGQ